MAEAHETRSKNVVVVGAGMAGLTAAVEAKDGGARVIVTEKFPDVTRSSTALAGGGFDVQVQPYGKYTKEELVDAFRKTGRGLCDINLVSAFANRLGDDYKW